MAIFNGTSAANVFTGGADPDIAYGNGGDDSLTGAGATDILAGGAGADILNGGDGDDRLYSGDETTQFSVPYYTTNLNPPILDTGTDVDTLVGGDGWDRFFAGYGDNVDGGAGPDYLYISFMGSTVGVTADFGLATQVIGGGTITGIDSVSWMQGSNFDDTLTDGGYSGGYSDFGAFFGMGGNDHLTAAYYTGSLYGGDGDDIVDGRPSQYQQYVSGGAGNDILYTPPIPSRPPTAGTAMTSSIRTARPAGAQATTSSSCNTVIMRAQFTATPGMTKSAPLLRAMLFRAGRAPIRSRARRGLTSSIRLTSLPASAETFQTWVPAACQPTTWGWSGTCLRGTPATTPWR